jgi:hypothetical protein
MRISHGPFNVDCLTTKAPRDLLQTLTQDTLPALHSTFRLDGDFKLLCERERLRYTVEITQYEYTEFLYVLKFDKLAGDPLDFNKLCLSILRSLNL